MIYDALLVPYESPTSLLEIKRALLTYDKVKIVDPDDRDLVPSNSFLSCIGMPPIFGMNVGPVRPMGKVTKYNEKLDKTLAICSPALKQGLIEVISTYKREQTQGFTIGAIPSGGYPLKSKFVFELYRGIVQNQDFLRSAIAKDKKILLSYIGKDGQVSLKGIGDSAINDSTPLPKIENPLLNEMQREFLTEISRARIAALIKYAGYCEQKELIPVFSSSIYSLMISVLLKNIQKLLGEFEQDDTYWFKRNRVLDLCHEEFLDDRALDEMTLEQVLKLRTKIWGKQAKARELLFESVGEIAEDIDSDKEFEKRAKERILQYKKISAELENDRKILQFKIKCDLIRTVLGGVALSGQENISSILTQMQSPFNSIAWTLVVGGIWGAKMFKEHVPPLKELKDKEASIKRGAGFGLHNFYLKI